MHQRGFGSPLGSVLSLLHRPGGPAVGTDYASARPETGTLSSKMAPIRALAGSFRAAITCAAALAAMSLLACGGGHATAPTPVVEQPAPQPTPDPPPPPPPPSLRVARIFAFGDSMTEGTTSAPLPGLVLSPGLPQSYPYKLQTLVNARYTAQTIAVINDGKAGEHVVGSIALARFNNDLSAAKPDLILLMEGANDLNDTTDMVNAAITDIVSTLEEMVKEAGRRQIPIMVATLPPQRPPRSAAPNIGRFNDAVKVMAAKKGGILVDVNARMPLSLIGQDGLHPTEDGYQRIAEIYLDAIKGAYESAATTLR
jgi:lysophospholipase L1-like esterase